MTFRRYRALQDYWRQHPPADFLVAGYLGYKPPGSSEPQRVTLAELAQMTG
jgi:hypothetical protein